MLEDYIRTNYGNDYARVYKKITDKQHTQIDLNFISILATGNSDLPVSIEKETVIKDGKLKVRYILETELKYPKTSEE